MKRTLSVLLALVLLFLPLAPALAESDEDPSFSLTFAFDGRGPNVLDTINAALSGMELSLVSITDMKGYLITITIDENDGSRIEYGYGFDSLALRCDPANEDSFVWHLGVEAYPEGVYQDSADFKAAWESVHPDRVIRSLTIYKYGEIFAYIYLDHARVGA